MFPPIFAIAAADGGVTALFGSSPTRIYPFGEAPQGVTLPYAVWQTISGLPENCLNGVPGMDVWSLQVDVYASTATSARSSAEAIRDAIETSAHIVGWRGESRDPNTNHYRYSFDVDWHVDRATGL